MKLQKLASAKVPPRLVLTVVTLAIISVSLVEGRALYNIEHPKPGKLSCIKCHADKHSLKAMAEKADDPLYLVRTGDLTLEQLNKLTGEENDPAKLKKCPVNAEAQGKNNVQIKVTPAIK